MYKIVVLRYLWFMEILRYLWFMEDDKPYFIMFKMLKWVKKSINKWYIL